ncbi:MFS transporter [Streptomyces sp. NPDC000594]|uniref:MFS transporter n=1 Tax=Streptomyces sp. NPDC000594 TaxID=3154261 RepID=UPI0033298520
MTHQAAAAPPPGRGFTAYLWGESASLAGSAVSAVALPALAILHLDATPGQVAVLAALNHLPAFVLALPAGVIADRTSKKHLMIWSDLTAAGAVTAVPVAAALDALSMGVLYAVTVATGSAGVLHQAAAIALVPQLAAPGELHRANAQVGATFAVADSAGTYLGTALVAALGPARSLIADTVSYLVGAWCATRLRPAPGPPPAERRSLVQEIGEGLTYTARTPLARILVLALVITSAGAGLVSTFWAYHLLTALDMGTTGLGVIMGVSALGAFAGALAAPRLVARHQPGRVLLAGFALCPLAHLPLLLAHSGPGWIAVLAAAGAVHMAGAACAGCTQRSVRQAICPPTLQGRAQQTSTWLITGTRPFAALAAGALVAVSSVPAVLTAGVVVSAVPVLVLWCSPVRYLAAMPLPGGQAAAVEKARP